MTEHPKWEVPTADEIDVGEAAKRKRGPLGWLRKLRVRPQVGEGRTIARPGRDTVGRQADVETGTAAPPDPPENWESRASSPQGKSSPEPPSREVSSPTGGSLPTARPVKGAGEGADEGATRSTPAVPPSSSARRRKVTISEKAENRRTSLADSPRDESDPGPASRADPPPAEGALPSAPPEASGDGAVESGKRSTPAAANPPPATSRSAPRRKVKIGEKAKDRRTGRATETKTPSKKPSGGSGRHVYSSLPGPGGTEVGRCSCGWRMYGRADGLYAAWVKHRGRLR